MSSKLIKNTSLYTIGNILPQAAGFILLPIYTRYLTPADYGIVSSMQVLSAILIIFFTLAINRSIYRLYFDYKTERDKRDYLGTVTISLFFVSIIILILLFVFKCFVEQIYKSIEFYPFYVYAILTTFFSVFLIIPKIYFQVNERAGIFITLSILQFLIGTGLVLWFIIEQRAGAAGMLKGRMIANIAILPIFLYILLRTINFTFKPKILKESLAFSLPMIPGLLSAWILNLSDRIFIERYFSLSDVGIYSLGYRIAGLVLIFSAAFYKAYNPVFYKLANLENKPEAKKKLHKYNSVYILVIMFAVFFISFFSREAITLLLDPKYIEAHKIVPIIAFAYLISQTGGLLNLSIYQDKKTLQMMYMILGSAILNIILNFLLVPTFGAYGAAYATVLSFSALFGVRYWYAKRCYFIPFNWYLIGIVSIILFLLYFISVVISSMEIYYLLGLKVLISILLICVGYWFLVKKFKIVKWSKK